MKELTRIPNSLRVNMILRISIILFLFSLGCAETKTTFIEHSISFRNEAQAHLNSPKPYHKTLDTLYSFYHKTATSSIFLRGSEPILEQMGKVYIILIDYRFASYNVDKDLGKYREVFQREIDLLDGEIDNFSAQK